MPKLLSSDGSRSPRPCGGAPITLSERERVCVCVCVSVCVSECVCECVCVCVCVAVCSEREEGKCACVALHTYAHTAHSHAACFGAVSCLPLLIKQVSSTLADGLAVPTVGGTAFHVAKDRVDKMVQVKCVSLCVLTHSPLFHEAFPSLKFFPPPFLLSLRFCMLVLCVCVCAVRFQRARRCSRCTEAA